MCCRGPRRATQLREEGAYLGMHGARADHQALGYVVVAYSDRHQPQHLHFALGQSGRPRGQRLGQFR